MRAWALLSTMYVCKALQSDSGMLFPKAFHPRHHDWSVKKKTQEPKKEFIATEHVKPFPKRQSRWKRNHSPAPSPKRELSDPPENSLPRVTVQRDSN